MISKTTSKRWALINLAGTLVALTLNGLANGLPLNGYNTGEISDFYPNLFVPAGITFSIWGFIYLLIIGFTVHGLIAAFKKNENTAVKFIHTGPWYVISCLANASWIVAWHYEQITVSLGLMFILLYSLIRVYTAMERAPVPSTFPEKLTLRWPFSIYLGWITIATVANVTAWLVSVKWTGFGLPDDFWLCVAISAAMFIAVLFMLFKKDAAFGWVIVWAFAGIILKRNQEQNTELTGYYMAWSGLVFFSFLAAFLTFRKTKPQNP
jgi:hypothetical protein